VKDDRAYLLHIRDAIDRIVGYTCDGRDAFFADLKTQDAVLRNLEIIAEAVKQLSVEVRDSYPQTPWRQIAGMRDILIHQYFGVKLDTIWQVIEVHLRPLRAQVVQMLHTLENENDQ
jgi:uncharacterized protein with HEPN domain